MAKSFFNSWKLFWHGAKNAVASSQGFPGARERANIIIDQLLDMEESEIYSLLSNFSWAHHKEGDGNPKVRVTSDEILDSLGEEIEEIVKDEELSEKQRLDAYSVGIGSLKDILGELSPWMKNVFTLLKEIFDLLRVKKD